MGPGGWSWAGKGPDLDKVTGETGTGQTRNQGAESDDKMRRGSKGEAGGTGFRDHLPLACREHANNR